MHYLEHILPKKKKNTHCLSEIPTELGLLYFTWQLYLGYSLNEEFGKGLGENVIWTASQLQP